MQRTVQRIIKPQLSQDGAGVSIKRFFPVAGIEQIDPFLLFDHFGSENPDDFSSGFPMHPHRGIETVTYMLAGRVRHRDSSGHQGSIERGDVQWMSAGRGILHEEMPEVAAGALSGLQFWVNLPAKEKMKAPAYRELTADQITDYNTPDFHMRLICGEVLGQRGPIDGISRSPLFADIELHANPAAPGTFSCTLPTEHQALVYGLEGQLEIAGTAIAPYELIQLSAGSELSIRTQQPSQTARFILLAAAILNEPMVRWGPFVMNTRAEIEQTLSELRRGEFPPP